MTKELQTILKESARLRNNGERAVLATVVDVQGSSYRLPGAKMLIGESGAHFGTVSGGCLEADVLERAKKVLQTGATQVFVYDTTKTDDSVFSLNMGCRGVIRILLEPAEENEYFRFVDNCTRGGQSGVAAVLIRASGKTNLQTGARFFFSPDDFRQTGFRENDFAGEFVEQLFADSQRILQTGRGECETYKTDDATIEFFLEVVKPPLNLIVFGAGADAVPLVEFAKNLGWRASVVDHRPAFATKERFPNADEISILRADNLNADSDFEIDRNTAAVVMTHNYDRDKAILKFLLNSAARYVGALGPRRRTESILRELEEAGEVFGESDLDKLHAPVGLDIGADTPESIALSIVAEINSVLANRDGGFLRNRPGSIYNRNQI